MAHLASTHLGKSEEQIPGIDQINQEAWAVARNNPAQSQGLAQQALELSQLIHYERGKAKALRTLGVCRYLAGDYEAAFGDLSAARALAERLQDKQVERDCYNYSGALYVMLGELDQAMELVEKTYWLSMELGDQSGIAFSLNNMGHIYDKLGRFEDGLKAKLEALEISRAAQDRPREATAWGNVVNSYTQLGRFEEAIRSAQDLLALCQEQGYTDALMRTLVNLGEAYCGIGEYRQALIVLAQAEEQIKASGMREGEVYCDLNIARVYMEQNQPLEALRPLEAALQTAQELGAKELEALVHLKLSECQQALGRLGEALEHYKTHHKLEKTLGAQQTERKLRVFSTQRELEQTRAEAEIAHLKNVELKQALDELHKAHLEKTHLMGELEQKSRELQRQAEQDPLTHLANRRYLEAMLAKEFTLAQKAGRPLPLVMLDVDNFKRINDTYSHQVGDQVLQVIAEILNRCSRSSDIIARYGGEEFVMILPQTRLENALRVCERVRQSVEDHPWQTIHPDLRVTLSLGLASDSSLANQEKLLSAADEKLYQAKRSGKNQVCH